MPPLISIVTVTLNSAHDLLRTVASVRSQRFTDFEHIIKDGGSTDGSVETVRGSGARILSCPDLGIYDAMNQALPYCEGKYVLFLNCGDELFDERALEKVATVCHADNSPCLVYTDYATTFERKPIVSPARLHETFLFRTMLCHQACFVRRDCYERYGGFDTGLKVMADYDFLLRLVLRARVDTHHISIVGVVSKEGGYSSRHDVWRLGLEEVAILRRRYFSLSKRIVYGACYSLTFPRLRIAVIRSPSLSFLRPVYRRTANAVNRLLYGGPRESR